MQRLVAALRADARIESWPDDLGYDRIDVGHVVGHRQVTDAYLASPAVAHGTVPATPHATVLIPE